ncbi:hypothetical protein SNEBB_006878 [Seison nebaliae]|nr:hypothetical protein SNEBB_006878 [Seison nebaliae]
MFIILILQILFNYYSCNLIVDTKFGKVRGTTINDTNIWWGIPFATPPTKSLRWKDPIDPNVWFPDILDCTKLKPACPQINCEVLTPKMLCPTKISEDCLYLNVYAPTNIPAEPLPVLVYIHGGNFRFMSSSSVLYWASNLVKKSNTIVVTIEYRLGILGFLFSEQYGFTGNYGLKDQELALKWVYENINRFNGNPDKITLSGQSAGAQSTAFHATNLGSRQYFQQVIIESSPSTIPFMNRDSASLQFVEFNEETQCSFGDTNCLYNLSWENITIAQAKTATVPSSLKILGFFEPFVPVVDGKYVFGQIIDVWDDSIKGKSHLAKLPPILMGSLTEECVLFIYSAWNTSVSLATYLEIMAGSFGEKAIDVMNKYPPFQLNDERPVLSSMATDWVFSCATRYLAQNASKVVPVYRYLFDHAISFDAWGPDTFCKGRVCHGSDIPYVFQTAPFLNYSYTDSEIRMSDTLIQQWSSFVKTGNPNNGSLKWPLYNVENDYQMLRYSTDYHQGVNIISDFKASLCNFWNKIGYHGGL